MVTKSSFYVNAEATRVNGNILWYFTFPGFRPQTSLTNDRAANSWQRSWHPPFNKIIRRHVDKSSIRDYRDYRSML